MPGTPIHVFWTATHFLLGPPAPVKLEPRPLLGVLVDVKATLRIAAGVRRLIE